MTSLSKRSWKLQKTPPTKVGNTPLFLHSLRVSKVSALPNSSFSPNLPPRPRSPKKSNSSPPETANSTQTGGRGSGRKGGKGTGDGGGGGTGKGEKGGPRRAVDCYFCQSPVARSPGPGECSGPSSCKWAHHFKAFRALLIETNGQLPPGLGGMLKGKSVQKAYRAARSEISDRRHHHTPSDSGGSSSSETDDGSDIDTRSVRSRRSHRSERSSTHKSSRKKRV